MTSRYRIVLTTVVATVFVALFDHDGGVIAAPKGDALRGQAMPLATPADSIALDQARGAAKALGQDLMGALVKALDAGGPAEAISFCADSAQARTARFQAEGLIVRRVSKRLRNAANAPDSLETAALAMLAKRHAAKDLPAELAEVRTAADGSRTLHYLKPIVVAPACLACHGPYDDLDPNVREMIMLRYPKDDATGFKAGDLRGAISVRVRVPEAR
jgi:hypothetical protein